MSLQALYTNLLEGTVSTSLTERVITLGTMKIQVEKHEPLATILQTQNKVFSRIDYYVRQLMVFKVDFLLDATGKA